MTSSPHPRCLGSPMGFCVYWVPKRTWSASQINIMELIDRLKFNLGTVLQCSHPFSFHYSPRPKISSYYSSPRTWIWALRSHEMNDSLLCLVLFLVQLSYFWWLRLERGALSIKSNLSGDVTVSVAFCSNVSTWLESSTRSKSALHEQSSQSRGCVLWRTIMSQSTSWRLSQSKDPFW